MKRGKIKWLALPLALMLVVLAGCQAVAGFDINKALLQNIKPTSGESKQTLSVELVPAEGQISEEDQKTIDLINSFSLSIDHAKTADANTASVKGTASFDGKKLPFHLAMDEKGLTIQAEGAKQPVYISLADEDYYGVVDMNSYQEKVENVAAQAAEFLLKHLPNPSKISVKQGSETVNGESVNLTNLSVEVGGDELLKLAKPFLENALKDSNGIKAFVGGYYDIYYPLMMYGLDEESGIDGKTKAVQVAAMSAAIQEELKFFLQDYDKALASLMEETPELSTILGKDTVLKMNVSFDGKLNVRKSQLELNIALPAAEDLPIKAIKVRTDMEQWNVGGTVEIDKVDTSAGVLDVEDDSVTPGQLLRNFDQNSPVYALLKDQLQIGYKFFLIDPYNDYYGVVTKKNTTFVPLWYVADELDAQLQWTPGSKQIVIVDDMTGAQIVVSNGSNKATVNGKTVTLAQPVFIEDGTTYVPLRFIAESLGATVNVDEEGWITVERP